MAFRVSVPLGVLVLGRREGGGWFAEVIAVGSCREFVCGFPHAACCARPRMAFTSAVPDSVRASGDVLMSVDCTGNGSVERSLAPSKRCIKKRSGRPVIGMPTTTRRVGSISRRRGPGAQRAGQLKRNAHAKHDPLGGDGDAVARLERDPRAADGSPRAATRPQDTRLRFLPRRRGKPRLAYVAHLPLTRIVVDALQIQMQMI